MTAIVKNVDTFSLDPNVVQFSTTPVTAPPFVIQGSTTSIPPMNRTSATMYTKIDSMQVNNGKQIQATPPNSTDPTLYASRTVNLTNILFGKDYLPATSLVDIVDPSTPRYELQFIAIHVNDLQNATYDYVTKLPVKGQQFNISIVFRNGRDIYHIIIPLYMNNAPIASVNPFLRTWLLNDKNPTGNYSVNQLFNFSSTTVAEFDSFTYTANYNQLSTNRFAGRYKLCVFKTPHIMPNFTSDVYDQTIFGMSDVYKSAPEFMYTLFWYYDHIFNFAAYGDMNLAYPSFPLQLSPDKHVRQVTPNSYPLATFYTIPINFLMNIKIPKDHVRKLSSVKCYPIDLVSQMDNGGGIYVDEQTAQPVDLAQVMGADITRPSVTPIPTTTTHFNYWNFILALAILFLLILFTYVVITMVFKHRMIANPVASEATMASEASLLHSASDATAAAAAPAAAAVAVVMSASAPSQQMPPTQQPIYQAPSYQAPIYQAPIYQPQMPYPQGYRGYQGYPSQGYPGYQGYNPSAPGSTYPPPEAPIGSNTSVTNPKAVKESAKKSVSPVNKKAATAPPASPPASPRLPVPSAPPQAASRLPPPQAASRLPVPSAPPRPATAPPRPATAPPRPSAAPPIGRR
uniref:Uncharacterized protein n=1 Tax=viral metagenome TaxID=1070528 RepID=A0A6C0L9S6_9ZZZZ